MSKRIPYIVKITLAGYLRYFLKMRTSENGRSQGHDVYFFPIFHFGLQTRAVYVVSKEILHENL